MLVIPKLALHEVSNYINQLYVWKNYIWIMRKTALKWNSIVCSHFYLLWVECR
jgi:hypothetical protein